MPTLNKESVQDYIKKSEHVLKDVMNQWEPKLLELHGNVEFSLKDDRSVVTVLDGQLEEAIKDALRPLNTNVGFVGEENGIEGKGEIFWFVDPIDGTEQFIRGMDSCRTLLTLIMDGEPIYAFAYRFTTGDLYTAIKGEGIYKNGSKIVHTPRTIDRCWIEFATNMNDEASVEIMKKVGAAVHSVVYTREFLNIVDGYIDGYIVAGGKGSVWDYAPRALFLSEVGMKVTNIGSDNYDYRNLNLIAAHPKVYEELRNLLSPQA